MKANRIGMTEAYVYVCGSQQITKDNVPLF